MTDDDVARIASAAPTAFAAADASTEDVADLARSFHPTRSGSWRCFPAGGADHQGICPPHLDVSRASAHPAHHP
jgi:hypothetical protein